MLALVACTVQPRPQVFLKPGVSVPLPQPETLGHPLHASHLLTVEFEGQHYRLPAELQVAHGLITLVALGPFGSRLIVVRYDGRTLREERSPGAEHLPPSAQVLADVMLVHWPVAAWRDVLPAGWRLEQTGRRRRLLDAGGAPLEEIVYPPPDSGGAIELVNHAFGYRLSVTNLADAKP